MLVTRHLLPNPWHCFMVTDVTILCISAAKNSQATSILSCMSVPHSNTAISVIHSGSLGSKTKYNQSRIWRPLFSYPNKGRRNSRATKYHEKTKANKKQLQLRYIIYSLNWPSYQNHRRHHNGIFWKWETEIEWYSDNHSRDSRSPMLLDLLLELILLGTNHPVRFLPFLQQHERRHRLHLKLLSHILQKTHVPSGPSPTPQRTKNKVNKHNNFRDLGRV